MVPNFNVLGSYVYFYLSEYLSFEASLPEELCLWLWNFWPPKASKCPWVLILTFLFKFCSVSFTDGFNEQSWFALKYPSLGRELSHLFWFFFFFYIHSSGELRGKGTAYMTQFCLKNPSSYFSNYNSPLSFFFFFFWDENAWEAFSVVELQCTSDFTTSFIFYSWYQTGYFSK